MYLLKRAELAVQLHGVALAEFDLTPTQFLMLFHLRERREVSAASLAREVGVRPQSVIEVLAPLERKRVSSKREASRTNRRILHTRLTAAGQKLLAGALRVAAGIETGLLSDLNDSQLRILQEALAHLWARAESHELHPGSIRARAQELMQTQLAVRQRRSLRPSAHPQRCRGAFRMKDVQDKVAFITGGASGIGLPE